MHYCIDSRSKSYFSTNVSKGIINQKTVSRNCGFHSTWEGTLEFAMGWEPIPGAFNHNRSVPARYSLARY
jgi:hypothetical protein